ncbi:MAG: hypothetical protein LBI70_00490 [Rickettsiales bacterium]|nr:hypothetical protein [Rickettsiales bacterium]
MWKVIKYGILFFIFSGRELWPKAPRPYRIPENEIREIETLDHELCFSEGHDLLDNYGAKLYWSCRLRLVDERIEKELALRQKNFFYIGELRKIRVIIKNLRDRAKSRANFYDSGEIISSETTKQTDNYRLILRRENAYYYNLFEFSKYDLDFQSLNTENEIRETTSNIEILNDKKIKLAFKKNLEKHSECAKFNFKSKHFIDCLKFKNEVENCKTMALEKIKNLEYKNKFDCKIESIKKYPDHMVLYNSEYQELKNIKRDEFILNKERDDAVKRRLAELNTLISGPRLSSIQLIDLRKYEEQKCNMQKMVESNVSKSLLIEECENMLKKSKRGNE